MRETRDFSYSTRDVKVVFASDALAQLGRAIDETLGPARCLLVATPRRTDILEKTRDILGARLEGTFDGATLHVPSPIVATALQRLHESEADCVVTIGGGSAIGLGKALVRATGLPLVAVPTTYSGSEMTDIWGVTDGERKQTGRDPKVAPRLVVYDPVLTYTMPPHTTGASGMNAIAHSVEALYSDARSPATALLAEDGIRRLAECLPVLMDDPRDGAARWNALCGAHHCGRALDMTTMGLHHKLCHVLGGLFDAPHALTHAIVLPHVVAYNTKAAPDAMATVASALGAADAAHGLWLLNQKLGLTHTLNDLGVGHNDVDRLAQLLTAEPYPNPAPVTPRGVRRMLERAIAGEPPE